MEEYYRKYSRSRQIASATMRFLSQFEVPKDRSMQPNVTGIGGGSFFVPPEEQPAYFRARAVDLKNSVFAPLNEAALTPTSTLAFEIDYRFASLEAMPSSEVLMDHLRTIHRTVSRYYPTERATMRLLLYAAEAKPKYKDKRWMVAYGFHMIYNRSVTVKEGAQLSHAAKLDLQKAHPAFADVIDNIYVANYDYKKVPQLRPPYASKQVDCYYCNDKSAPTRPSEDLLEVRCKMCDNFGKVYDSNVYTLRAVWTMDGAEDPELLREYQRDAATHMLAASIWGTKHPHVIPVVPDMEPTYTLFEIAGKRPAAPRGPKKASIQTPDGKGVAARTDLISFGMMHVKARDEVGVPVPAIHEIVQAAEEILAMINPAYSSAVISASSMKLFMKGKALQISLSGPGATFCMAKGAAHSTSRANVWLVKDKRLVYAGCYSKKCQSRFQKVHGIPHKMVEALFEIVRKRTAKT